MFAYLGCNIFGIVVVKICKPARMRKSIIIRIALLTIIAAGSFLLLRSGTPGGKDNSCKESIKECCQEKDSGSDKMVWESLQFFSSI
jgi:hypothetical protein